MTDRTGYIPYCMRCGRSKEEELELLRTAIRMLEEDKE